MSNVKGKTIRVKEPPKIPTLSFSRKPSIFPAGPNLGQKGRTQGKFNQSTFHTQHKGGQSGSK